MGNWVRALKSAATPSAILKASMVSASALLLAIYLVACVEETSNPPSPTPTETHNTVTAAPEPSPTSTEIPRPTPTPYHACTQTRILVGGEPITGGTTDFGYYLICVDGSSVETLTTGKPYYYDPSVSPINRLVAFATEKGIAILDLAGNVIQVIEAGDFVRSPSWSPDGEFIAYIRDGQFLEVVNLETGVVSESLIPPEFRHPQQIVEPGFENVDWSPDGKHLALNANSDSLFLLDVTCSAESHICSAENFRPLADRIDGKFSWSPDSEEIVGEYLDAVSYVRTLRIIDLQGRVVREYSPTELMLLTSLEFNVDLEILQCPVWSPDGNEIAFSDGRDVWILSLADNSLVNLTRGLMEIDSVAMMAWVP